MGHGLTKEKNKIKDEVLQFESKEEYFSKNGGILMEKQIALCQGQDIGAGQLKIYSSKEIQNATNCYDSNLIVSQSPSVIIYKVILDDHIVAITTPPKVTTNPELRDLYLTATSIGMVMTHANIVKLYGCCLETYIPIIVYEFLPRGNLYQYLHGNHSCSKRLKWADCLRVITDISYALAYMHNALSKPVVHRDVKSDVVLLDDSFHAKLTNFAYSVSITPGDASQRWPVQGTPGYIDPEYVETQEVTDKCDVYSFGVLMLEILTAKQPIVMARAGLDLVDEFVSANEGNCVMAMVDNEVLEQASRDEIEQVVQLALKCVEKKGSERPTMVEVVTRLWQIRD